jgi:hypothetical protein
MKPVLENPLASLLKNSNLVTVLSVLIAIALTLSVSACGADSAQEQSENSTDANGIAIPDGWELLEVDANRATTQLFTHGHFHISWTPCYREAFGSVKDPKAWDQVVRTVNAAIKAQPLAEERCFDGGPTNRLENKVIAKLTPDKRPMQLMESWGGNRICTTIADAQLARDLHAALNQVVRDASREDCYIGED